MCHPGRPGPHGEGQAGSPGLDDFHNAKSAGDRRPDLSLTDKAPVQGVSLHPAQNPAGLPSPSSRSSRFPLLQGSNFA